MNRTTLSDYITLCKPRVVLLMLITVFVAMLLATPATQTVNWSLVLWGNLGIALTAFSGGAANQIIDQRIDSLMARTKNRPIATGRISIKQGVIFTSILGAAGLSILVLQVNTLTALLSFFTLIGYAGIYTLYLKRATPQNIVIGGLAGAMPPLLGWCAITNQISHFPLLLVLIIFTWTPPHFWALAIYRLADYRKVGIPMLPVTHGIPFTKLSILLYTLLMCSITYLPFAVHATGMIYVVGISLLNACFLYFAIRLYASDNSRLGLRTFYFSILYLFMLFILLLVDHYA